VIGGNYLVTEPSMAITMGPIVFVVVVFGAWARSRLLHRLADHGGSCRPSRCAGLSFADLPGAARVYVTSATPFAEFRPSRSPGGRAPALPHA